MSFTNADDLIDSRKIISRIEELQNQDELDSDEAAELKILEALAATCEGYGDWMYGTALINEDYFTKYIKDLIDDNYNIPRELCSTREWPYRHITIDYDAAAREVKSDYAEVDFDGQVFLIRA
jgi:hypothetical protein